MWMSILLKEFSMTMPDTSGFWVIGERYRVSKHSNNNVRIDRNGQVTVIDKYRARQIFAKPEWIE